MVEAPRLLYLYKILISTMRRLLIWGERWQENTLEYKKEQNGQKEHPDSPFYRWKMKIAYAVGKFMAGAWVEG